MSGFRSAATSTPNAGARTSGALTWHRTPVVAVALAGAVVLAATGLALSRPDLVAVGIPLALCFVWALRHRPEGGSLEVELSAAPGTGEGVVTGNVDIEAADADWVQLAVDQAGHRTGMADVAPGEKALRSRSRLRHSGPIELLAVTARGVALDGAWASDATPRASLRWSAVPALRRLRELPVAPRLTGLHGSHEGARPGQGGDFRDIHPFAPGDELRRVDWRATARLARTPGELYVRRVNTLSDSSVVIAVDTADDLGEVVATWGSGDLEQSGTTSLDLAREAALSLATAAIETGDRVAFHELAPGGRTLRSGAGARYLARLRDVISATGVSGDGSRFRRTPPIAQGSIVFVLSTFFDGAAAELATRWRASGHAVVAVDVLPQPDDTRLSSEQRLATRTLLAERSDILLELRRTGVEVLAWRDGDADAVLRMLLRGRHARKPAVRR
ncbi:DUF58 domain-containing protein [Microbacterium bovistercoris]|uniref:DUF58 domain-containing protein n=1 Tax=Microbacterium bovistercoris TaxID=2293570 RepID=A0A371NSI4_9MICO|nr:DUF58 domain-containing protein [Microbacterium bovistercoris]REJ04585.1 DUF58 domain-containing protein [Microbacterium bovistercoris]